MVESKLVELVVAGSSPVGHPTFFGVLGGVNKDALPSGNMGEDS